MNNSLSRIVFAPILIIGGFATLFGFQNCSREVAFNSTPSTERPGDVQGNDIDPDGFVVGGDAEVIIRFNETPRDQLQSDAGAIIDYEVIITGDGELQDVNCTLNGDRVRCGQADQIPVATNILGPGKFNIEATVLTPVSTTPRVVREQLNWTIYSNISQRTKNIQVSAASDKVDVIINVDNSGSMEYEQSSMAGRIQNLVGVFSELDYRISVITTSPIGNDEIWKPSLPYVDGKFLELAFKTSSVPDSPQVYCARKASHTQAQTQEMIQANVIRPLYLLDDNGDEIKNANGVPYAEGNGWERGIFTTYRSIERFKQSGSPEASCLRQGVPKHVIVISDERETTMDEAGNALDQVAKSNPDQIRRLFSSTFPSAIFKFHSLIVNPYSEEGQRCLATHGARPGVEYAQLSRATGGVIGSVCAEDYADQLGRIGQLVLDSRLSYTLDCISVMGPDVPAGRIINRDTGAEVSAEFRFVGDKIELSEPLTPGNYQVVHYCYAD